MRFHLHALVLLLATIISSFIHAQELKLTIRPQPEGPILSTSNLTNGGVRIEKSLDLKSWMELGVFERRAIDYYDSPSTAPAFYRGVTIPLPEQWSPLKYVNQLNPYFNYLTQAGGRFDIRYIKFVIDLAHREKVWFHLDWLHHTFVSQYLPGFQNISVEAFDQISLSTNDQKLLLGTIYTPPLQTSAREYGIQFVGNDPYPPEFVAKWFNVVKSRLVIDSTTTAFYIPEFEQTRVTEANADFFARNQIQVASLGRWSITDATYSQGWAHGVLKYIPADQLQQAFNTIELTEKDILLTDHIPADIPRVAGIITLSPSSPGSHVAILARSEQVPFVYLASEELRHRAKSLTGKYLVLRASEVGVFRGLYPGAPGTDYIKLFQLNGDTNSLITMLDKRKTIPPLQYRPMVTPSSFSRNTVDLTPADIDQFGGKASNYGLLRRSIPTHSPKAIGISFALWQGFMNQILPSGKTLQAEILSKLATANASIDPLVQARELETIREMIKKAEFSPDQKSQILAALQQFDSSKNIRFRSSSNVEDSETYVAAGLYDSFSGCVLDDTDTDSTGPSHCDPTEEDERGVFRAIKKVFASFYNDRAYSERKRRAVREEEVGMALLVHHSFPDEIELANGVVVLTMNLQPFGSLISYYQTTQLGAISVANPDGITLPEIRWITSSLGGSSGIKQGSSLVPAGQSVMNHDDQSTLGSLLVITAQAYAAQFTNKTKIILDYEFKVTPQGVVIKQIREVPEVAPNASRPIAINEEITLKVPESHLSDLFSAHYLKSEWQLEVNPTELTEEELAKPLYSKIHVTYHDSVEGKIKSYSGPLTTLPGYSHSVAEDEVIDSWRFEQGGPLYQLSTRPFLKGFGIAKEIQSISDWQIQLSATFSQPKLTMTHEQIRSDNTNRVFYTNFFGVALVPILYTNQNSLPVYREWTITNDTPTTIRSDYFWVRMPEGEFGGSGYTSPLVDWSGTSITGLTPTSFSLKGRFPQTYNSARKNSRERFLFDPWLDPTLPAEILFELETADIRKIYTAQGVLGLIDKHDQIRFFPVSTAGYPSGWW